MKYLILILLLSCTNLQGENKPPVDVIEPPVNIEMQDGSDLDGSWKVIQIDGLGSFNDFPTFVFDREEMKVSGYAGCNNYFASYELKGAEITFGEAGSTRKMCQSMVVEDAFLKKLKAIAYYKVVKSELHLFDAKDKMIMLAIAQ